MHAFNFFRRPVALAILAFYSTAHVYAADFKPGDKVDARSGSDWQAATVVRPVGSERYTVKLDATGDLRTITRDKVRKSTAKAGAANVPLTNPAANAPPSTLPSAAADENPFKINEGSSIRVWSDTTGKHKVEAEFVEMKGLTVVLKNREGKTINLPLNKLSRADQEFVRDMRSGRAASLKPVAPGANLAQNEAPPDAANNGDWSEAQPIVPQAAGGQWRVKPDKGEATKLKLRPAALRPKGKDAFFEKSTGMVFVPGEIPQTAFIWNNEPPGQKEGITRLELCALAGPAQPATSIPFPNETALVAVATDGKQMISRSNVFGFGKNDRLDVWSIEASAPSPLYTFYPYGDEHGGNRDVKWATYVGPNRLLTQGSGGKVACWDLASRKALYWVMSSGAWQPALSPTMKQLAVMTNQGVAVLDVNTGEALGLLPGQFQHGGHLAFQPDGARLAVFSGFRLAVFDLTDGNPFRDLYLPISSFGGRIDWPENDFLLVDGRWLIDVPRRVVLWEYRRGFGQALGMFGGSYWLLSEKNDARMLVPAQIPDAAAKSVAATLDKEPEYALKPGSKVTIEMNINATDEERRAAMDHLTKQLTARGMEVADNQPLKLTASTNTGKTEEITYYGADNFSQKVSATQQVSTLALTLDGKLVWQRQSFNNAPARLRLKIAQTVEQALEPYRKPDLSVFTSVVIPSYLPMLFNQDSYGVSDLAP